MARKKNCPKYLDLLLGITQNKGELSVRPTIMGFGPRCHDNIGRNAPE